MSWILMNKTFANTTLIHNVTSLDKKDFSTWLSFIYNWSLGALWSFHINSFSFILKYYNTLRVRIQAHKFENFNGTLHTDWIMDISRLPLFFPRHSVTIFLFSLQTTVKYEFIRNFITIAWPLVLHGNFVRLMSSPPKQISLLEWLSLDSLSAWLTCVLYWSYRRDFMWNSITGSIPPEIGNIKSLELL